VEQLPIPHHRRVHADGDEGDLTGGELLAVGEGPENGGRGVEGEGTLFRWRVAA